jgi:hypothetical protein
MSPDIARTLGSFRNTLPYSAACLAALVSADPSSVFHPPPAIIRPTPSIQYDLQIPKNSCISGLGFFVTTATTRLGLSPAPPVALPRRERGRTPCEGRAPSIPRPSIRATSGCLIRFAVERHKRVPSNLWDFGFEILDLVTAPQRETSDLPAPSTARSTPRRSPPSRSARATPSSKA